MEEDYERETLPIVQRHPLSEVVPYRDGVVTISANPKRLKMDFINETRSRGEDVNEAEKIAEKLKLYFDKNKSNEHLISDFQRKGLESTFWRAMTPVGKIALTLSDFLKFGDVCGAVYSDVESPALYLNPHNLVSLAKAPKDSHSEIVEAAIIQRVESTWRHEREHLVRLLNPESISEDKRNKFIRSATVITTHNLIFFGTYMLQPEIPSHGDPRVEAYNAVRLFSTVGASIYGSQTVADGLWYYLWNKAEKAAREQGKEGENLPILFDFHFEKISNV